jgi:hypothetical protein
MPSGSGKRGCPTADSPNDAELKTLKSLGVNGRLTATVVLGSVIAIVGDTIDIPSYTDVSAIPNVSVLYVLITRKSNVVAMLLKNNARGQRLSSYPLA